MHAVTVSRFLTGQSLQAGDRTGSQDGLAAHREVAGRERTVETWRSKEGRLNELPKEGITAQRPYQSLLLHNVFD
jgi:hypothetical protein